MPLQLVCREGRRVYVFNMSRLGIFCSLIWHLDHIGYLICYDEKLSAVFRMLYRMKAMELFGHKFGHT